VRTIVPAPDDVQVMPALQPEFPAVILQEGVLVNDPVAEVGGVQIGASDAPLLHW
jgi:hypothetical protein